MKELSAIFLTFIFLSLVTTLFLITEDDCINYFCAKHFLEAYKSTSPLNIDRAAAMQPHSLTVSQPHSPNTI